MLLIKKKQSYLFQFEALTHVQSLTHAIVGRRGGVSHPPFDSMNLSQGVGDDPVAVATNREQLPHLTGGGVHVYTRQNHGTTIRVIAMEETSREGTLETEQLPADALITNVPGLRLLIQTADCQAVMIFDPQTHVVANIHCGWRGSVSNILGTCVSRMVADFGCDPGQMIAAIGPSLGPCCAEFINYQDEIPEKWWSFRMGTHHFDFWRISRHQLVTAGFKDGNIHESGMCTRCNPHLFFSYRAARQTGRFAALIGINKANRLKELKA